MEPEWNVLDLLGPSCIRDRLELVVSFIIIAQCDANKSLGYSYMYHLIPLGSLACISQGYFPLILNKH